MSIVVVLVTNVSIMLDVYTKERIDI